MYLDAIDRTKPEKLYYQLLEILKKQIETSEWGVGTQIPTEDQLCGHYNVSKATVRLAIAELVSLGYLKKLQGKGTFVRRRKPGHAVLMLVNFDDDANNQFPPRVTRIIESKTLLPDDTIRNHLHLYNEEFCFYIMRLVLADGAPISLQHLFISYSLLPGLPNAEDLKDISPYAFLENNCGIKIKRIKELVDVPPVSRSAAEHLELAAGEPLMRVRHICYTHGDTPISFSESFYRTDTHARTVELERLRI